MAGPLATSSGLAAAAAASSATRSQGDSFLTADRKNKMEKQRLEKHLKALDRDCAKNEFVIERQKKTVVLKWKGMSFTTGHSDRSLPPDGPQDHSYDKSKYSHNRLSEKRLMQWKAQEKQLEKFLNQYRPRRPQTSPAAGSNPRLSLSRPSSERPPGRTYSAKRTGGGDLQRCKSAVAFSSRVDVYENEDDLDVYDDNEEELGGGGRDSASAASARRRSSAGSTAGRSGAFQPGLRCLSTAQFYNYHLHYSDRKSSVSSQAPPKQSHSATSRSESTKTQHPSRSIADIPDEERGTLTKPSPPAVTVPPHQLSSTAALAESYKEYKEFERSKSLTPTKFFVTKDNVVMTCRQLHSRKSHNNDKDTCFHSENNEDSDCGNSPRTCNANLTNHEQGPRQFLSIPGSRAERMSTSSLSSEDSVFVAEAEQGDGRVSVPNEQGSFPQYVSQVGEEIINEDDDLSAESDSEQQQLFTRVASCPEEHARAPHIRPHTRNIHHADMNRLTIGEHHNEDGRHAGQGQVRGQSAKGQRQVQGQSAEGQGRVQCRSARSGVGQYSESTQNTPPHHHQINATRGNHEGVPGKRIRFSAQGVGQKSTPHSRKLSKRSQSSSGHLKTAETAYGDVTKTTSPPSPAIIVTPLRSSTQSSTAIRENLNSDNVLRNGTPGQHHERRPSDETRSNNPQRNLLPHPENVRRNSGSSPTMVADSASDAPAASSHWNNIRAAFHRRNSTAPNNITTRITHNINTNNSSHQHTPNTSRTEEERRPSEELAQPQPSQWRRDLVLENPAGLRPSVNSLGTVLKAAMVFSKAARKKALSSMVEENNVDTREVIRKERLRVLQSRANVLSKVIQQFPVNGQE